MATEYLILTGKQAAKAQNEVWWNKVLGRPKKAEDITSMIFMIVNHPSNDTALVYVDEEGKASLWPKLTTQEQNNYNANKKFENDPAVIQFKADVEAARPPGP